jgi:glutamate 5-kinase
MSLVVAKIGSSSITTHGTVNRDQMDRLAADVASLRSNGHRVVIVTSGAIAAGLPALDLDPLEAHSDEVLRAASAVGQISLMGAFDERFAAAGMNVGQVLLAPTDFMFRRRYLKSKGTIAALLELGVVPVINENDAIADDEIRFGDNDRLGALVAHLVEADLLVLLTDMAGLFTADPRVDTSASLIEEIVEIDKTLEAVAGGVGSSISRGGMASKLAAAKIATWSGVETLIASASRERVLVEAVERTDGVGTRFVARDRRLAARKLWIAFAVPAAGRITVDAGARKALEERNGSLLPAGVRATSGTFAAEDAVEIVDSDGAVFAKGRVRWSSDQLRDNAGKQTNELPPGTPDEVVHRDDLVVLPA